MSTAEGFLDGLDNNALVGWASYGRDDPRSPQLEVRVDGQAICTLEGKHKRPGVRDNGRHPTGLCGFRFSLEQIPRPLRDDPRVISIHLLRDGQPPLELHNSPTAVVWDTGLIVPRIKKLFFMHIAKAAGTSANHLMASYYSPQACATHIETQFNDWPKNHAQQFDFISGHIEAPVAQRLGLKDYVWVTLFRRPRPHMFSHINWLRHVGADPDSEFHRTHPAGIRQLSLKLAALEPGDEPALARVLDMNDATVRTLFDNRQTRYLLARNTERVDDALLEQALQRLDWFDLVGSVEQIDIFNRQLPKLIGSEAASVLPSLNRSPDIAPLNFEDYSVDMVLPFIRYDRVIYNTVQTDVRRRAGLRKTGRKHGLARQPKPRHELLPRLSSVEQATHPGRQPCTALNPGRQGEHKTFVVLGVSRGGTSMLAGLLKLAGVFMGDKLSPGSHEDVAFHSHDTRELRRLVDMRNAMHPIWGWKYPHTLDYLSRISSRLRNPHYIVIYRDIVSVAQAYHRHDGTDMKVALRDAKRRYDKLTRFALGCETPLLSVSYEKAISDPNATIRGLADFGGLNLSMQQKAQCIQFINPGRYTPIRG